MKLVYKIAMIGAVLASGITAASAQNTGRSVYDNPARNWNSDLRAGPFYSGEAFEMRDHNNYGVSRDYIWATPQNDSYSPGER